MARMGIRSVTVLICTHNRAWRLAETLEYFVRLPRSSAYDAELVVVDNRSSDGTRVVIEDASSRASMPIAYAFEPRQGRSFALNRGLAIAGGDVLALTDDDVVPAPDWLDRIVDVFRREHVVFAGGRVLPHWCVPPPAPLLSAPARDIWGPLALLDYGDQPFRYTPEARGLRRPVGANMAVR